MFKQIIRNYLIKVKKRSLDQIINELANYNVFCQFEIGFHKIN